jgi:hypothetical protein
MIAPSHSELGSDTAEPLGTPGKEEDPVNLLGSTNDPVSTQ